MKLGRCVLSSCIAAAFLAACGGSQQQLPPQTSLQSQIAKGSSGSNSFATIYSFTGGADGAAPHAELTPKGGLLYGTAPSGGNRDDGTVFRVSPAGAEQTLHAFNKHRGGGHPLVGLRLLNGVFYGTTKGGYARRGGKGAVFSMSENGRLRILHRFASTPDGENPDGDLLAYDGALYGTTFFGGTSGLGTVFKLDASGEYQVLYSFKGYGGDGGLPLGALVEVGGVLYGVTRGFGSGDGGTVYSITTSGQEKVIYNFSTYAENDPEAGLIAVDGVLYGTTYRGGKYDGGTVYAVTTDGQERVLCALGFGRPGYPVAPVTYYENWLYGVGVIGGTTDGGGIFRVKISTGEEQVLYSFVNGSRTDGYFPEGGLAEYRGKLYGTTYAGGTSGSGTIYELRL